VSKLKTTVVQKTTTTICDKLQTRICTLAAKPIIRTTIRDNELKDLSRKIHIVNGSGRLRPYKQRSFFEASKPGGKVGGRRIGKTHSGTKFGEIFHGGESTCHTKPIQILGCHVDKVGVILNPTLTGHYEGSPIRPAYPAASWLT